jgi:hypothetical protein
MPVEAGDAADAAVDPDLPPASPAAAAARAAGDADGKPVVPDWGLYVKDVPVKGRAVFAGKPIPARALVIRFEGPIYDRDTCPEFSEALQVGVNAWMWSSGGLDDLVNHSCTPNTGLWQVAGETYLLSLRAIGAGEELSFDYSTSMVDEPWGMDCACGEAACRGRIGNFLDMPDEAQQVYAAAGVLPEHVWVTAAARGVVLKRGPDAGPAAAGAGGGAAAGADPQVDATA